MIRKLPIVGKALSTVCGERFKKEFKLAYDGDGRKYLKECGDTDLQAQIDSYEPSVNLQNIIARFQAGDVGVLERANAFYADATEIPVKLQDVLNMNMEAKRVFDGMPKEVRELYGNSYVDFLDHPEKINDYYKQLAEKQASNVPEIEHKSVSKEVVDNGEPQQ